jgi:8-amino-7-oxononanoate synthase
VAENVGQRLHHELNELEKRAQLRALDTLEGINLCSNDYLGLSNDPRLRQAVENAVGSTAAVASTGSRLLSGNSRDWEELESDFAEFAGTEAALYFSSGYAANVRLLSSLLQPSDIVFSDSLNHSSIIDGIRLSGVGKVIYEHCDLRALQDKLENHRSRPGARAIVTESVFSMDGDKAPLSGLLELAKEYDAELIIDEAQ